MKFLSALLLTVASAQTALEVVLGSKDHTTLAKLAGSVPAVADLLKSAGPFTLFAPTDAAFNKIDKATLDALAADTATLAKVLSNHAVTGVVFDPATAKPLTFVKTAAGQTLGVKVQDKEVTIAFGLKTSKVTGTVKTSNGVVHVVDTVLTLQPSASTTATEAGLTELVKALAQTNLAETVDKAVNVTIFAPNNQAFADLVAMAQSTNLQLTNEVLTNVLGLHVVPGVYYSTDITSNVKVASLNSKEISVTLKDGSIYVAGTMNTKPAKVIIADVLYANGVVHVIDGVLLPGNETVTAAPPKPTGSTSASSGGLVSGSSFALAAFISVLACF